jgi:hypothetical protein
MSHSSIRFGFRRDTRPVRFPRMSRSVPVESCLPPSARRPVVRHVEPATAAVWIPDRVGIEVTSV